MKPSDLKPGDHFQHAATPRGIWRMTDHPHNTPIGLAKDPGPKAICVIGHPEGCATGEYSTWTSSDVELVPMPHTVLSPYVVGRAYRTRNGERVAYEGRPHDLRASHLRLFRRPDGTEITTLDTGRQCRSDTTAGDIMGEWREPEALSTTPKETPPMRRTLPTVTLDQIFNTLRDKDACWYRELGPLKLAKKLEMLSRNVPYVVDEDKVSLRTLHGAVLTGAVSRDDVAWYSARFNLFPQGGLGVDVGHIGTPAFEKALDEWENPKPKLPPVHLDLDGETAAILATVMDNVGGQAAAGHPRAAMEELRKTLRKLGVVPAISVAASGSVYINKKEG